MLTNHPTFATMRREFLRFNRHRDDLIQPLVFFGLIITVIALAIGPDSKDFARIAPAATWIAVMLAVTTNLPALFARDFEDGTLEQLTLSSTPLALLVAAKIVSHWLAIALPQVLVAGTLMLILGVGRDISLTMCLSILLGSPLLLATGSIAAALTLGARSSGTLVALLAIPLYIPVLIFGTSAVTNAAAGLPITAELYFLAGLSVGALSLAPIGCSAAIHARLAV